MGSVLSRLRRVVASLRGPVPREKEPDVRIPGGLVSFSFDDIPRSASTTGARILEANGFRGTYYVCMGFAGTEKDGRAYFTKDDLVRLAGAGHEIGCHTLNHVNCAKSAGDVVDAELSGNAAAVRAVLPGYAMTSFAFPFGAVDGPSRRRVAPHFESSRSTVEGLNEKLSDLTQLRAIKVYENRDDFAAIHQALRRAQGEGRWAILYTHDVEENPSPWGATPALFGRVATTVKAMGIPVATVRDATRSFSGETSSTNPSRGNAMPEPM